MVPFLPQGQRSCGISLQLSLCFTMYSISPTKLTMGAHSTHIQEIELKVGGGLFRGWALFHETMLHVCKTSILGHCLI